MKLTDQERDHVLAALKLSRGMRGFRKMIQFRGQPHGPLSDDQVNALCKRIREGGE